MKCIIYGLGSGRIRIERYLKKEHCIIGYSDGFFKEEYFENRRFYKPNELLNADFNVIIIAVGNLTIADKIEKNLIGLGISSGKIINFYKYYRNNFNIYDEIIKGEKNDYQSIILGLSHSFCGISKKHFKYKPLKLSTPMQDLYYNLKKLKEYSDIIRRCRSVIIDMYTYTYFNYDVSLGSQAIEYISENGFKDDLHNYSRNKNFNINLKEELEKEKYLFEEVFNVKDIRILKDYIDTGKIDKCTLEFIHNKSMNKNEIQSIYKLYGETSIQKNIYTDTEKENIHIFENILSLLKETNNNIDIYIVLIPQYCKVEKILKIKEKEWKSRFYNIINSFKLKYKFKVLDFKNCEEISANEKYYFDAGHLNDLGAKEFTKLLNCYID